MKKPLLTTRAPTATVLIRLMVGGIFLSEGIQKFLFPDQLGVGRFEGIGIPAPEIMAPLVGGMEVVGGGLILLGLATRIAAVPLIIIMGVAILSTKIPILLGHEFLGFSVRSLDQYGLWSMLHASRNDICLLLGSLYLLIEGAGPWSFDRRLAKY